LSFKSIVIENTRKELSALSGLIFFNDVLNRLGFMGELSKILPRMQRIRGLAAKFKFKAAILAFIAGAECLDDLDDLREDQLFSQLCDGGVASTTMGKFLRLFRLKEIEQIQNFLPKLCLRLRQKFSIKDERIIITMDATGHEQYGRKMEGVEFDGHKKQLGLSSQNAFDQYGFCYGWELRSGATHSSVGATNMIQKIFSCIPKSAPRYFRADSAYGNLSTYNALLAHDVKFAICLSEVVWGPLLDEQEFKMPWNKTKMQFFVKREDIESGQKRQCQIANCFYLNKGLKGRSFLRVVFIRAKKRVVTKEDKRHYDYYAIITNISESEMKNEKIIYFYRQRANCENHIKDLKYGMDFLHFPCQKLNANRAWGLMGIFAYNLMRFAAFIVAPETGCFLKRVRRRMVYLAGEVRQGQRKIVIRFSNHIYQEVTRLSGAIHKLFSSLRIFPALAIDRHTTPL